MSLQQVKNSIKFWDGLNTVWNAGLQGVMPLAVQVDNKISVNQWIDRLYVSAAAANLLNQGAASGKLRIGEQSLGASAYTGDVDRWIGINFSDISNLYWFNPQGFYVRADPDLIFIHEVSHIVSNTSDPGGGLTVTDFMMNGGSWDFCGGAVDLQNSVANQTGRPDQVRASYNATIFGARDQRHEALSQGVSYTDGQTVSIVRLGSDTGNNQDHTGRLDNSPDLILGLDGADYIHGGGGDDHLYGGNGADQIYGGTGDDRLFGEGGDDRLAGNVGVDLLHGGFNLAVNPLADHEADGDDEAHYDVSLTSISGLGIEIGLSETVWSDRFASLPDFGRAIFVRDLARDGAVDTLISIEHILGTDSDDRFVITSFDQMRIAGADGTGGLRSIDLGDHVETSSQAGDLLDLSGCDVGVLVDFSVPEGFVCSISDEANTKIFVKGVERVIGSQSADVIKGKGNGLLEGGNGNDVLHGFAGDILIGGTGADEFHLRTDRLSPSGEGNGAHSPYDNTILILGFDPDDALYIDGVKYTGYSESGTLVDPYYADEVNALVYSYEETRSGSHWNGQGQEFRFGTTNYWSSTDLASNAGISLSGRFELTLYGPNGEGLRVLIAGYDPTEGGINFVTARDYVDPPDWGTYTQHVGYSNGYNIFNPSVIPHNPNATYEQINVGVFDFYDDWASRLPTGMANHASYLELLGNGGVGNGSLNGGDGSDTVVFAGVTSTYAASTVSGENRVVDSAMWQDTRIYQRPLDLSVFELDKVEDDSRLLLTNELEHERGLRGKSFDNGSTTRYRHDRLSVLQHELWGGPARVTSISNVGGDNPGAKASPSNLPSPPRGLADHMTQNVTNDAASNAEIARKLAMIRQDLGTFGIACAEEGGKLWQQQPESLCLYA